MYPNLLAHAQRGLMTLHVRLINVCVKQYQVTSDKQYPPQTLPPLYLTFTSLRPHPH